MIFYFLKYNILHIMINNFTGVSELLLILLQAPISIAGFMEGG